MTAMSDSHPRDEAVRRWTRLVAGTCLLIMVLQAAAYLALGTAQAGRGVSGSLILLQYAISIGCAWLACRRARGISRLFWLLFLATDLVLMIPSILQIMAAISTRAALVSDATWRALYVLYGAPVLMMMVLPDCDEHGQIQPETFVDLLQVALVVGLAFSILFFVPLQQMLPANALEHNLTISNLVSLLLLFAIFLRLRFARTAAARDRLRRLAGFLFTCAFVTFIGNWIDQHGYTAASAWWDLGWDLPIIVATLSADTWRESPEGEHRERSASFLALFGKNLALVAVLFSVKLIMDQWNQARGVVLTQAAIVASLLAYTVRLAMTQRGQHQEIARREAAQRQLTDANNKIGVLLEEARQRAAEITQINELVSLLQACASPADAYKLTSECLQRLFPEVSGCLAALDASKVQVESVTEWGPTPPKDRSFSPSECWALRRGSAHIFSGAPSALRCSHLSGEGRSVCIPLISNGVAVGTLAVQEQAPLSSAAAESSTASETFNRRCDLIVAVSRHLSLALANLQMREALRLQAVRDPLTGLYNRRYMQEFLDRETTRASRNKRPVSVLALDLDHFKSFNDNYGHATGDLALKLVGEFLLDSVRSDDVACRYGGEEFTIILPECSLQQAMRRGEQIRAGLERRSFEHKGKSHTVTVSIGVAAFDETTDRVERLLACADEALYEAKRAGRNRVVAAPPVAPPAPVQADAAVSGLS